MIATTKGTLYQAKLETAQSRVQKRHSRTACESIEGGSATKVDTAQESLNGCRENVRVQRHLEALIDLLNPRRPRYRTVARESKNTQLSDHKCG
jgi:hypothetical protein